MNAYLLGIAIYFGAGFACYLCPLWSRMVPSKGGRSEVIADLFFCVLAWPYIAFTFGYYFIHRILDHLLGDPKS